MDAPQSDKVPPPPGAVVVGRNMLRDSNNEPQYGERVPYVIVRGSPGSRLVDRVMDPLIVLNNRYAFASASETTFKTAIGIYTSTPYIIF